MLLANPSILSYWMIACAYVLCTYCMCIQILTEYGCISQCTECPYHYIPFLITLKDYSSIDVHYFCYVLIVTVLCMNIYLGYCIATVGDDRYGVCVDRFWGMC